MRKSKIISDEKVIWVLEELSSTYPDAKARLDFTNPFEALIATMLSAQTTDDQVNKVTKTLFVMLTKAADIEHLTYDDVAGAIKSCGLYKTKAKNVMKTCQILNEKHDGEVPSDFDDLVALPGVGRKTANVVQSVAFGIPAIAVDTHVFRVSNRIGITDASNVDKTEAQLKSRIPEVLWSQSHHLLIFHGRGNCKARKPDCESCVLLGVCKQNIK